MIVAVDGPVAAGKGTLARRLAEVLDLAYLDTGSIYRAVASTRLAAPMARSGSTAMTAHCSGPGGKTHRPATRPWKACSGRPAPT